MKNNRLFRKKESVIVGVSGGADSVFLLHALCGLSKTYGLKVLVAHLNHKLRAKAADGDEKFVRNLCEKMKIPFVCRSADTKEFAKTYGLSLEDAARRLRHEFFFDICREYKIGKVVLAHTRDDQAETVLMRFIRGAGLQGLSGIRQRNDFGKFVIVRPLLRISKREILDYLDAEGIDFRTDKSNFETKFLRNRLRLEVIPYLKKFNPQIVKNICNMAEGFEEIYVFLQTEAEKACARIMKKNTGKINLKCGPYLRLSSALRKEVLRRAVKELLGNLLGFEAKHFRQIDLLAADKNCGFRTDLPGGLRAVCRRGMLVIEKKLSAVAAPVFRPRRLLPGRKLLLKELGIEIEARITKKPGRLKKHDRSLEYFDADKTGPSLTLRQRLPGDMFYPLGSSGKKKLKKFFIDQKISYLERDRNLLVCSGTHIIWVVGERISEDCKVTAKTKKFLLIKTRKIKQKD